MDALLVNMCVCVCAFMHAYLRITTIYVFIRVEYISEKHREK